MILLLAPGIIRNFMRIQRIDCSGQDSAVLSTFGVPNHRFSLIFRKCPLTKKYFLNLRIGVFLNQDMLGTALDELSSNLQEFI